jgi:hypothetical protein
LTVVVIFSGMEKTKDDEEFLPTHTSPDFKVKDELVFGTTVENDILAVAHFLDLGVYPTIRAKETTFSLREAESKKVSLTIKLELNAVMYVLYASISINTDKLDPSKSKSVKSEFARI